MPIRNILVALAGSGASFITFKYALYISKLLNAKLFAIYVIDEKTLTDLLKANVFVQKEVEEYKKDLENQGNSFLERVKNLSQQKDVDCRAVLLKGSVHDEILNFAEKESIDLIIIGELKELFSRKDIFYQPEERILRDAKCPVIIVKNQDLVERLFKEI